MRDHYEITHSLGHENIVEILSVSQTILEAGILKIRK